MDLHASVRIYSHHFEVSRLSPRGKGVCSSFAMPLVSWKNSGGRGFSARQMDKVYAASDASRVYFRFHINLLEEFKEHLKKNLVLDYQVTWETVPMYEPVKVELPVRSHWQLRENQIERVDYLVNSPHPSRLLTMPTGTGKGISTMVALSRLGLRPCIVIQPKYIKKWIKELVEVYEFSSKEIMVVQGQADLMGLLVLAKEGRLKSRIVIVGTNTMQAWITKYEELGDYSLELGYECRPQDFFQHIGAGVKVVDEVHQQFHLLFKIDLYTHCPISISMSATMISQDAFIRRMHEIMFPFKQRSPELAVKKYIDSYNVYYNFKEPERIRTTEYGSNNYSHNAFEASVMKHTPTLLGYIRLIDYILQLSFIQVVREKKRVAIYASSTDMCTKLMNWFQQKYPQYDIRRYCASLKDPFENVLEGDIIFSTIGSSGTAIDIPDLTTVILSNAISSIQANVQVLGRLRELKDGYPPEFYFLTAANIGKHMEYYLAKRDMLKQRARSFKDIHSGHHI